MEILRKIYYYKSLKKFKRKGKNVLLSRGGKFIRPEEIELGNNVFINTNFHISARNLIFGDNIMIGPNLVIECDDHIYDRIGMTMFETRNERKGSFVTIENDVWIGANVTILKNVTIGEGSIIGAGSIVTKNIPPYTIALGSPCKPIRTRFSQMELQKHLILVNSDKCLDQIVNMWKLYKVI